jgi:ribosomal protein L24E
VGEREADLIGNGRVPKRTRWYRQCQDRLATEQKTGLVCPPETVRFTTADNGKLPSGVDPFRRGANALTGAPVGGTEYSRQPNDFTWTVFHRETLH